MTETRKVTGLLGAVAAEAEGAEWEVSTALQNGVVPGMGLGASPDAISWAQQGWLDEEKARRTQKPKRAANRPPKDRYMDIDCIRAFSAWRMAQQLRKLLPECDIGGGIRISNRELIRLMQGVDVNGGVKLGHGAAQNWATLGLCGTRVMGGGQSSALSI